MTKPDKQTFVQTALQSSSRSTSGSSAQRYMHPHLVSIALQNALSAEMAELRLFVRYSVVEPYMAKVHCETARKETLFGLLRALSGNENGALETDQSSHLSCG